MFSTGARHFSGIEVIMVNEADKNPLDIWVRGAGRWKDREKNKMYGKNLLAKD